MTNFLIDTNGMVAAVSEWHQDHERAAKEIHRRLDSGEDMVLAAHSLVEAYSVLTRLPPPRRLPAVSAVEVLEASFGAASVVTLEPGEYRALLRGAPGAGISGGRIYDAIIAECAFKADAAALVTFNARHFLAFARRGIQVVVPS